MDHSGSARRRRPILHLNLVNLPELANELRVWHLILVRARSTSPSLYTRSTSVYVWVCARHTGRRYVCIVYSIFARMRESIRESTVAGKNTAARGVYIRIHTAGRAYYFDRSMRAVGEEEANERESGVKREKKRDAVFYRVFRPCVDAQARVRFLGEVYIRRRLPRVRPFISLCA